VQNGTLHGGALIDDDPGMLPCLHPDLLMVPSLSQPPGCPQRTRPGDRPLLGVDDEREDEEDDEGVGMMNGADITPSIILIPKLRVSALLTTRIPSILRTFTDTGVWTCSECSPKTI